MIGRVPRGVLSVNASRALSHPSPMTVDTERERELIRRFRAGDGDAFHALIQQHRTKLERRAERLLPDLLHRRLSVGDVVQEAMLIAYRRREDFEDRGPGSFGNWLLGLVENKAKRAVQHHVGTKMRGADREVSRGGRPETRGFVSGQPSPSQAAIGNELEELARRATETLSQDHQEVLRLIRRERLALPEVAERMGRSHEAIKKLYQRALARFTENFERLRGTDHG